MMNLKMCICEICHKEHECEEQRLCPACAEDELERLGVD